MPRPKKNVQYSAGDHTIRRFFERSRQAQASQKEANNLITSINGEMESAGVHPGVMSTMRRIAKEPEGKRGYIVFLYQRYLSVLARELQDPQIDIEELIAESKAAEAEAAASTDDGQRHAAGKSNGERKSPVGKGDAKAALEAARTQFLIEDDPPEPPQAA